MFDRGVVYMINKATSRLILRNNSPLLDQKNMHPSNKIGAIINDNVIKVKKGSALDDFINEREELKQRIKMINDKVSSIEENSSASNSLDLESHVEIEDSQDKETLQKRLDKVDNLITSFEKGYLMNSIDKADYHKPDGMNMLA